MAVYKSIEQESKFVLNFSSLWNDSEKQTLTMVCELLLEKLNPRDINEINPDEVNSAILRFESMAACDDPFKVLQLLSSNWRGFAIIGKNLNQLLIMEDIARRNFRNYRPIETTQLAELEIQLRSLIDDICNAPFKKTIIIFDKIASKLTKTLQSYSGINPKNLLSYERLLEIKIALFRLTKAINACEGLEFPEAITNAIEILDKMGLEFLENRQEPISARQKVDFRELLETRQCAANYISSDFDLVEYLGHATNLQDALFLIYNSQENDRIPLEEATMLRQLYNPMIRK
jgi:hypothetical protein